jgi:dihydroneopterin triphosphate diphosphatase
MARAPFQVLIYPYRQTSQASFEYALLRRSDEGFWQGIAGGGEDNETLLEAAKRESYEEAGIANNADFLQLDTVEYVPVTAFRDSALWGEQIYVIPQYSFGVWIKNGAIVLSHEHSEFRWLPYEEASKLVKFAGNRTVLWELDKRLKGRGPRG